jgi:hypothetical protein
MYPKAFDCAKIFTPQQAGPITSNYRADGVSGPPKESVIFRQETSPFSGEVL